MMYSLLQLAAKFIRMPVLVELAEKSALDKATKLVQDEAKRVIGTYEYGWQSLAESTLDRKSADTPLLETGELRESIQRKVEGTVGRVYSDSPIAAYQELGTATIPARSFLAGAARHKAQEVAKITGKEVIAAILSA